MSIKKKIGELYEAHVEAMLEIIRGDAVTTDQLKVINEFLKQQKVDYLDVVALLEEQGPAPLAEVLPYGDQAHG